MSTSFSLLIMVQFYGIMFDSTFIGDDWDESEIYLLSNYRTYSVIVYTSLNVFSFIVWLFWTV